VPTYPTCGPSPTIGRSSAISRVRRGHDRRPDRDKPLRRSRDGEGRGILAVGMPAAVEAPCGAGDRGDRRAGRHAAARLCRMPLPPFYRRGRACASANSAASSTGFATVGWTIRDPARSAREPFCRPGRRMPEVAGAGPSHPQSGRADRHSVRHWPWARGAGPVPAAYRDQVRRSSCRRSGDAAGSAHGSWSARLRPTRVPRR